VRDELEAAISTLSNSDRKAILDAAIIRKSARVAKSSGQKAPAGDTITCRSCSKANSSARKFCGDCGAMLWDACGSCGAEVPVDEKFCGICGANLLAVVSAELETAKATLAEAKQLRQKLDYDASMHLLRKLAKSHDPRLDDLIEEALALLAEIESEIETLKQNAVDALERAKMLLEMHAYEGAIAELQDIPEQFREDDLQAVLKDALAKRNEVLALSGDIRAAIEQKRTGDLLPKIERLLKLKPNHEQAQKLAVQLRDRLVVSAKKKLAEHQYEEAVNLLEQVPSFVRTPEMAKLSDHASELAWLADDLRLSPVADKTLVEIADRLLKAAPTHPQAAKLKQQAQERIAKPLADSRHRYHAWASAPKRTTLGWPVDWLTGFNSIRVPDEAHAEVFRANPGRFFVALGLALQGLDKAPVDMNLLPAEKGFSLKNLSSMLRKRGAKSAWGLDLSAFGLKAVKLQIEDKDVVVTDVAWHKHRKVLSQPEAESQRAIITAETMQAFLDAHSLQDQKVIVNMPGHRVMGRFFDLPPLELKKVPDAVEYEAKHQIPFNLNSLCWDWSLVSNRELAEHEESRRVVLVAARDFHIQERIASLRESGVTIDVLTSDSIALHNFMLHELFANDADKPGDAPKNHDAIVSLDVGAECTNLVISSPSVHWFRSFNTGGDHFTEPLVRLYKLTYAQAELLKREPFRAKRMKQLYDTFDLLLSELNLEITRSLDSFLKLYPDQNISRIYGLGGGFEMHGLMRKMRSAK
jgi:type IV pilus assembly protein PilM